MAEVAILDLESYRQEALEQKFRECLHRELDKWTIVRSHQAYGV